MIQGEVRQRGEEALASKHYTCTWLPFLAFTDSVKGGEGQNLFNSYFAKYMYTVAGTTR